MLHFYDRAGFARALRLDLDPGLHKLLVERISALTEDLIDHTEYLIVQAGDTEADIIRHIGLSPLIEPIDGHRYGDPGFHPHCDWLAEHDGWFEMIFTFGSAFACTLFIETVKNESSTLIQLCRRYHNPNRP